MSTAERWPLAKAEHWAGLIVDQLRPFCHRIEIAGSIRRRRPDVGDVEIVLVPKVEQRPVPGQLGLLDDPRVEQASLAWDCLDDLCSVGKLPDLLKGGDKYRCYPERPGFTPQLDVFAVPDPADWGAIFCVRTGPADFSRSMVISLRMAGYLMDGGKVWSHSRHVPTPEEGDFFLLAGRSWVDPEYRR